ncbi:MAG TPA: hypothetical protein VKA38_11570, partial [Draconibacterium sp.]|nr:hypothetical protein [Draconibacterium sp.]
MKKLLFSIILIAGLAFFAKSQGKGAVKDNINLENETFAFRQANKNSTIVTTNAIKVSASEKTGSVSFHFPANQIESNPATGLRVTPGHGGMTVGYNEINGPLDFTPLLKGLPHDLCNSPHWGYVIEGSMKIIYADGKEETLHAGEVYYLPPPHTAVVDKYVKYIEFSP